MRGAWVALLAVVLAGCPVPRGTQPQHPQSFESRNQGKPQMDAMSMLTQLCAEVSAPALTVARLESALVRAGINGAQVVPLSGSGQAGEPSHARFSAPEGLTLSALRAAFGEPSAVPLLHADGPEEQIFYPPAAAGSSHRCAIVVEVGKGEAVSAITLRRDPAS